MTLNPPLKLNAEVEAYVKASFPPNDEQEAEEDYRQLMHCLAQPPLFTTLRANTLKQTSSTTCEQLQETLQKTYHQHDITFGVNQHKDLEDVIVINNRGPLQQTTEKWVVVVGVDCGMAVQRGAHVYAMGILGAPAGMKAGDRVSVCADVEGKCLRGRLDKFEGATIYIGNGIAKMSRSDLFCTDEKVCGLAIEMVWPVWQAPSLSGLLPSLVFPQNLPSVICSHVLNPQPGMVVLDMCAAPGGKTTHICTLMQDKGRVVAIDKNNNKVRRITQQAAAWNLKTIEAYPYDSRKIIDETGQSGMDSGPPYPGGQFDLVMLDAPCSALGQRPAVYNKMGPNEVKSYPPLQKALLRQAVAAVRPGGSIVYSTCTIPMDENENMVSWALSHFSCLQLVSQTPHLGGRGWNGSALTPEQLSLVQRFTPTRVKPADEPDLVHCSATVNTDTIGFFIAKFTKKSSMAS